MRGKAPHTRSVTRKPSVASTALQLKLDNFIIYFDNAVNLLDAFLVQGGATMATFVGDLASALPYKNGTGGSSQGGTGTGGTGGTGIGL